jgi:hypothetical protein
MKRFLKFYQKDKNVIKMIGQSEKGFELIILSDDKVKEMLELLHKCEERGDELSIVWQCKFKTHNFIMYRNCVFSAPMDNINPRAKANEYQGKKFKITCESADYYTENINNQNSTRSQSFGWRSNANQKKYKDATLMIRMLKISELNFISLDSDEV